MFLYCSHDQFAEVKNEHLRKEFLPTSVAKIPSSPACGSESEEDPHPSAEDSTGSPRIPARADETREADRILSEQNLNDVSSRDKK